jgi:hypothetical protein
MESFLKLSDIYFSSVIFLECPVASLLALIFFKFYVCTLPRP